MGDNYFTDNKDLKFHLNHPLMKKIVALKEKDYRDKDQYDYAPFDFEDAIDSYGLTMEIIGEICGETIARNAEDVDTEGPHLKNNEVVYARGTRENLDKLIHAGLFGLSLPRKYGGLNFSFVPYIMAEEIVSRADAGFANIWGLQDCASTIHEFASPEIQDTYLPLFPKGATASMDLTEPDAGSDLQTVQLKAAWDEENKVWRLNGVKRFITNGDADIALVLARSEENTKDGRGLSLFLYERKHKALTVRRLENKLGIKGSPTCELIFKDAPAILIGEKRLGLVKYVMSLMNAARMGIGAQSVGISEAAYREALKYAKERSQFGKRIIDFPAIYEMLSLMKAKLTAARSLLYETARFVDIYKCYEHIQKERTLPPEERREMKEYQRLADMFTPLVKLINSEFCNQITYDAIQIHGGTGYMKDFPVERFYRDARITSIYEGTSQLQVVAALRGVTAGIYLKKIREYQELQIPPEFQHIKKILIDMTGEYDHAKQTVLDVKDNEYTNFHARRLVEMAGNIILGYLLLHDSGRDPVYKKDTEVFIHFAKANNKEKYEFIQHFELKDLGVFKQES